MASQKRELERSCTVPPRVQGPPLGIQRVSRVYCKGGVRFLLLYQRGEGESKLVDNSKGVSDDYYAYKAIDDMIEYNLKELEEEKLPAKLHLMGLSMGGGLTLNYACHGLYKDKIKTFSAISH